MEDDGHLTITQCWLAPSTRVPDTTGDGDGEVDGDHHRSGNRLHCAEAPDTIGTLAGLYSTQLEPASRGGSSPPAFSIWRTAASAIGQPRTQAEPRRRQRTCARRIDPSQGIDGSRGANSAGAHPAAMRQTNRRRQIGTTTNRKRKTTPATGRSTDDQAQNGREGCRGQATDERSRIPRTGDPLREEVDPFRPGTIRFERNR